MSHLGYPSWASLKKGSRVRELNNFVCRNCGSNRAVCRYAFESVNKEIRQCRSCGLMVLSPFPTEEDLTEVYDESYFTNPHLASSDISRVYGYVDYISERINKQKGYVNVCEKLLKYLNIGSGNPYILDFGCGLGFFLDAAFDFDFRVHGVEFNRHAIEYIRKRYVYPVSTFDEFKLSNGRYDVITMFDVIEHLRDPFAIIDRAHELLNDSGLLVISTMDSDSLVSKIMGKRLEDFRRIREHLYFFTRASLVSILQGYGFDVLEVSSHGHTFEVQLLTSRIKASLPRNVSTI